MNKKEIVLKKKKTLDNWILTNKKEVENIYQRGNMSYIILKREVWLLWWDEEPTGKTKCNKASLPEQ